MTTLTQVRADASVYPTAYLHGYRTGLVLFAAAFLGRNDALHFHDAGIQTTCVDIDRPRLEEMRTLYPEDWRFLHGDAWEVAERLWAAGETFDVVSADSFTGTPMRRSLQSLPLWCSLARRLVTATITFAAPFEAPDGWGVSSLYPRGGRGIFWLVLEPIE